MDRAVVFDSFALIAHFEEEGQAVKATDFLKEAQSGKTTIYMSVINLGEVYYITLRERGFEKAEEILLLIKQLPIKIVDIDLKLTISAAKLKARHPIAYADCFAAALAQEKVIPLVTGDPEFRRLEKDIQVIWV